MENDFEFNLNYFMVNEIGGITSYHSDDGNVRLFTFKDLFIKQVEPDYPDMVCSQFSYHPDTLTLKEKGHYLKHGGVEIGIWETYDKDGRTIQSVNMDENYPILWSEMEQILKDSNIPLLTAYSISRVIDQKTNKPVWAIGVKTSPADGLLFVIDAQTGEIITRETIDLNMML